MPKRVEDIIPNGHRSVRDVPVEKKADKAEEKITIKKVYDEPPAYVPEQKKPRKVLAPRRTKNFLKIALVATGIFVIVGIGGYLVSLYMARAVFVIQPKIIPVTVDSTVIATPSNIESPLVYELVSVKGSASSTVPATLGTATETKAKGSVTIYNNFQNKPWRLIAGTRLETDDGLVYRLSSTVNIPGFTTKSGTNVPGSVSATVIADQPGEKYNQVVSETPRKLHVVAYENNPKYETIYAKITLPIKGGYIGKKVTVNPTLLASTTSTLQNQVITDALGKLQANVPSGYILYETARTAIFDPSNVYSNGTGADVGVTGTVYGILFKKSDFVSKLAGNAITQSFAGLAYDTPGLENLKVTISNLKDFSPLKKSSLIVKVKGDMKLVGVVPEAELKQKFAGLSLAETEQVIRSFSPVIDLEKSSGQVVPPWSKIPTNTEKITIRNNYNEK